MRKRLLILAMSIAMLFAFAGTAYAGWGYVTQISARGCLSYWHDVHLHFRVDNAAISKFSYVLGRAYTTTHSGTVSVSAAPGSTVIFDTNLNSITNYDQNTKKSYVRPYGPSGTPRLTLTGWSCK